MRSFWGRRAIALGLAVLVLAAGTIVFLSWRSGKWAPPSGGPAVQENPEGSAAVRKVIGSSVQGRPIEAYTYGDGRTNILFVGGIHGGYEWNSVVLAYMFIDYLAANPESVPAGLSVTVVPSANPDGVFKVIGKEGRFSAADAPAVEATVPGRFNANGVDLNRNFGCKWNPNAVWRGNKVGAGSAPFSEPEARAIRDLVLEKKPAAAVFWHSQGNSVYGSFCESGILPGTTAIMDAYAGASGYPTSETFDAYAVTGDAEGWLASIGIPAITVELKTHETLEWEKNLAGARAVIGAYAK